jgi:S-adenosylmethionine:tRNA ribosyltransferase-isomerase
MQTKLFDYDLPTELVAQRPPAERDAGRMLVLHRSSGRVEHVTVRNLGSFLGPNDLLVVNRTRVIPARLFARKATGAALEIFLLHPSKKGEPGDWEALISPGRRVKNPCIVDLLPRGKAEVKEVMGDGLYLVSFSGTGPFRKFLEEAGHVPLPPYIKRSDEVDDRERYQTVFATDDGSVAAPTAGLHFTPALLDSLKAKGVQTAEVVLHVGLGTFLAVEADEIEGHVMHSEHFEVPLTTVHRIAEAKKSGGRVVAVGTTVCRALESSAIGTGRATAIKGDTDIFIKPGYDFKVVDALFTNFHQPKSTLLMLVSAFAGREKVLAAYQEAVDQKYRFFSYGDAMLID